MALALYTTFQTDKPLLIHVVSHIHMEQMIFALFCTAIAYLSFTLSFNGLFEMTPYRVPFNRFFSIMFISYTINFIVSSGGWAGIGLRSYLLRNEKVPYSVTVPISFAQNMVFNLVLICVAFGGLIFLREHPEFVGGAKEGLVLVVMLGLIALVAGMMVLFFHARFRKWFLNLVIRLGNWAGRTFLGKGPAFKGWWKSETTRRAPSNSCTADGYSSSWSFFGCRWTGALPPLPFTSVSVPWGCLCPWGF